MVCLCEGFRRYDWPKVYQTIAKEVPNGLNEVELGMFEDWNWTSATVWTRKDGFLKDTEEVMGIDGSRWATPVMKLHYQDGHTEELPAYVWEG